MKFTDLKLLLLLSLPCFVIKESFAQVNCGDGDCDIPNDIQVLYQGGGSSYSSFDIVNHHLNLGVSVPSNRRPSDLRVSVQNKTSFTRNVSINLSSNANLGSQAGALILFSDIIGQLDAILKGNPGANGTNSNYICGQNFLNGAYGPDAYAFFTQRREGDSNLSNECDSSDIQWAHDNKFSCPTGFYPVNDANVSIERHKASRKCIGSVQYNYCVQRSYDITCEVEKIGYAPCSDEKDSNIKWYHKHRDVGGLSYPLTESTCDATRAKIKDSSKGTYYTGRTSTFTYRVKEFEIVDKNNNYHMHDSKKICQDILNKMPLPTFKYTDPEKIHEPSTEESIGVGGDDKATVYHVKATYSEPWGNLNLVEIPWPDEFKFSGFELKYGEPFDIDNLEHRKLIRPVISPIGFSGGLQDCLGLQDSLPSNNICNRFPGPEGYGDFLLSFVDPITGVKAKNKIKVYLPEGRKGSFYALSPSTDAWSNGDVCKTRGDSKGQDSWPDCWFSIGNQYSVALQDDSHCYYHGTRNLYDNNNRCPNSHLALGMALLGDWVDLSVSGPLVNNVVSTIAQKYNLAGARIVQVGFRGVHHHTAHSLIQRSSYWNLRPVLHRGCVMRSSGPKFFPNDRMIVNSAGEYYIPLCYYIGGYDSADNYSTKGYCILGCKTPYDCEYRPENIDNLYFGTPHGGGVALDGTGELEWMRCGKPHHIWGKYLRNRHSSVSRYY